MATAPDVRRVSTLEVDWSDSSSLSAIESCGFFIRCSSRQQRCALAISCLVLTMLIAFAATACTIERKSPLCFVALALSVGSMGTVAALFSCICKKPNRCWL